MAVIWPACLKASLWSPPSRLGRELAVYHFQISRLENSQNVPTLREQQVPLTGVWKKHVERETVADSDGK